MVDVWPLSSVAAAGTATICATAPRVLTCALRGEKNYPCRQANRDLDVPLPDNTNDTAYVQVLQTLLPAILADFRPLMVWYLAGVDPYAGDTLGRLCSLPTGSATAGQLRPQPRVAGPGSRRSSLLEAATPGGGCLTRIRCSNRDTPYSDAAYPLLLLGVEAPGMLPVA